MAELTSSQLFELSKRPTPNDLPPLDTWQERQIVSHVEGEFMRVNGEIRRLIPREPGGEVELVSSDPTDYWGPWTDQGCWNDPD